MYKKIVQDFLNSSKNDDSPHSAALIVAYKALALQIENNEKRAAELVVANAELAFQNKEKENLAAELIIANVELAFQNTEKEDRAAELIIANTELIYQIKEKEKRAAELAIANAELIYQNTEKENRAAELLIINKELESFAFISSHDLQEPLRKIQTFSSRILEDEYENLSEKGRYSFDRIQHSALRMQTLIQDLLAYSRTTAIDREFETWDLNIIVQEAMETLKEELLEKKAVIEISDLGEVSIIPFQFRQLLQNLIANSLKFAKPNEAPHILIKGNAISYDASMDFLQTEADHYHIAFSDNGIGFDPEYKDRIFELFQRLHKRDEYEGTGIGLTIVKKIVNNHNGVITANAKPGEGAQFDIYLPV